MYIPAIVAIPLRIVFVLGVLVFGVAYMAVALAGAAVNAVLDR